MMGESGTVCTQKWNRLRALLNLPDCPKVAEEVPKQRKAEFSWVEGDTPHPYHQNKQN